MGKNLSTILADVDGLDQHCEYFQASPDKKTHCVFRPLEWWVDGHADSINFICFPELTTSFSRLIEPFCDNSTCALPKRNPSNHSELYGGRPREHGAALDAFARRWYSKDLELYERHCGTVKGPRFCRRPLFFGLRGTPSPRRPFASHPHTLRVHAGQVYGNASAQEATVEKGPFGEPIFAWEP